jgi:hypothetical protein
MEDLLVEKRDGQIPGLIRAGGLRSGTQLRTAPVLALRYVLSIFVHQRATK